jgi:hypothetical protein
VVAMIAQGSRVGDYSCWRDVDGYVEVYDGERGFMVRV